MSTKFYGSIGLFLNHFLALYHYERSTLSLLLTVLFAYVLLIFDGRKQSWKLNRFNIFLWWTVYWKSWVNVHCVVVMLVRRCLCFDGSWFSGSLTKVLLMSTANWPLQKSCLEISYVSGLPFYPETLVVQFRCSVLCILGVFCISVYKPIITQFFVFYFKIFIIMRSWHDLLTSYLLSLLSTAKIQINTLCSKWRLWPNACIPWIVLLNLVIW